MGVWQGQFTNLRLPKLFNLRADPFERGDQSILYNKWMAGAPSFKCLCRRSLERGLRASKNSRRGRSRQAQFDEVMRKMEAFGPGAN